MDDTPVSPAPANKVADDYDQLPYPSMPYPQTQPQRLAAAALLHGIDPPDPERTRVLELGCAAAGNIIPLAARFPDAQFVGIDLARRHVEEAGKQIDALGLTNIEVHQGDITQLSYGADAFDYIICHGVFSWVPHAAQEAILRICGESLTPNGVALVSYNVLPGWHLRRAIRDICLGHAGLEGTPQQRVKKVRAILGDIVKFAQAGDPYGLLLSNEARRIAHRPASYILGEFLVPENSPCTFTEFISRARRYDLGYVCEVEFEAGVPAMVDADARAKIAVHAGSGRESYEQYVDYFTGRTFRSSVLARGAAKIHVRNFDRLSRLHMAANFRPDPKADEGGGVAYKDSYGRALRTSGPILGSALSRLSEAQPDTLTFAQMIGAGRSEEEQRQLQDGLALLVQKGQVEVSSIPIRLGRAKAEFPAMSPLARAQAQSGQPWMTSLTHEPVGVRPAVTALAALLDGTNNRAALIAAFAGSLRSGQVTVPELTETSGDAAINQIAADYVERVLEYLERQAVLLPAMR